jgi:hypothetical protein
MSLSPQPPSGLTAPDSNPRAEPGLANPRPKIGWQRRLLRISLALFTFEIGIFLALFPWTESWNLNWFQTLTPFLQNLWQQGAFKGAVTGLGFVNIYIACLMAVHAFRKH